MTRCNDFYRRWSRDPNWCEHSPASVSQINAYITLVAELEQMGCDREFTFAKMPEGAARPLSKLKNDPVKRSFVIREIADVLQDPRTKRVSQRDVSEIIARHAQKSPPSAEKQIKMLKKRIERYKQQIADCERKIAEIEGAAPDRSPRTIRNALTFDLGNCVRSTTNLSLGKEQWIVWIFGRSGG